MKRSIKKILLVSVIFMLGIFSNVLVCSARDIEKDLPLNKTIRGSYRSTDGVTDILTHIYNHERSGYGSNRPLTLKITFDVKNIKPSFAYNNLSFTVFDNKDRGTDSEGNSIEAWDLDVEDLKNGESRTFTKTITTYGSVHIYIWGLELKSFDYTLKVEGNYDYATSIKIPSSVSLKCEEYDYLDVTKVYPISSNNVGVTWRTTNKKVATVDQEGWVYGKQAGTCYITATLHNGKTYKCKVRVSNPAPKLKYTGKRLYIGSSFRNQLKYASGKVYWSSSNKKIATVSSNGTIKAVSPGTCTVTAKYGKRKYNCKVQVIYKYPRFGASLYDYNTRDNYFIIKFRNLGKRSIIIRPDNAKVEHVAYKAYDRKLRLAGNKSVVIKPGKSAFIKFYVNGKLTWYDYHRYTLFCRVTYDTKTYETHIWDSQSVYRRGKKWYYTYWVSDTDWYNNWYWR